MKHIIRSIAFFTCMWLLASSCTERHKIKKALVEFTKSEIVIPSDLECINNRQITKINKDTLKSLKFIVYYDSLECSSCRVSNLVDIYELYEIADSCNFSVLTIFSPKRSDIENIALQLSIANHPIPIYLDTNESFKNSNKCIPSDNRFNTFCIDANHKPIYVGHHLANLKLNEVLMQDIIGHSNP